MTYGTTILYEYDGLVRLTKEEKNGTITIYTYDANGNRATMTQNGSTTTYTYDANNRLLAETAVIPTIYTYDANGNTIAIMKGGDPAGAYTYSLFGNQISYTPNGILYIYYTYRPDGLRHSIGDKVHVWDGANIVADVDGNDISVYIRGINLIYADDGDKTYYHFNAHGDVVVLTNVNGNKTKSYSYSAFGVEYTPSDFDDNPFRYCGEYYDKETQTIYLRARYYDANQGRFTQEDSIRDGDNWYVYCGNNSINRIDPTGEAWYHWVLGAAVVVACAVATVVTCGGFAAATTAVTLVASGTAAATTASTVAAGTFIGSSLTFGTAVATAALNSSSIDDFCDQGDWSTVAYVATGAVSGGACGYDLSKSTESIVENLGRENLKDSSINFSRRAGEHMNEQGRRVPISILGDAIRYGSESPDPRGSQALQYEIQMYRNSNSYNLTVVFDWETNTIYHFQYEN